MKTIKRILACMLAVVICFSLTACGPFKGYDDDAAIIKGANCSTVLSVEKSLSDKYTLTAGKFNGVKTVKTIELPENATFNYTLEVGAGKFKIVLVKGNAVKTIAEFVNGEKVAIDTSGIAAGSYSLRLVGQAAEDLALTFNYDFTPLLPPTDFELALNAVLAAADGKPIVMFISRTG